MLRKLAMHLYEYDTLAMHTILLVGGSASGESNRDCAYVCDMNCKISNVLV